MSHDAVLQLRRTTHVWSKPGRLLPIRLPPLAGEAGLLPLEGPTAANHRAERGAEVRRQVASVHMTGNTALCNQLSVCLSLASPPSELCFYWTSTGRSPASSVLRCCLFPSATTFDSWSRVSGMFSSSTTRSCLTISTSTQSSTSR